jgi:hypothetical protein
VRIDLISAWWLSSCLRAAQPTSCSPSQAVQVERVHALRGRQRLHAPQVLGQQGLHSHTIQVVELKAQMQRLAGRQAQLELLIAMPIEPARRPPAQVAVEAVQAAGEIGRAGQKQTIKAFLAKPVHNLGQQPRAQALALQSRQHGQHDHLAAAAVAKAIPHHLVTGPGHPARQVALEDVFAQSAADHGRRCACHRALGND